MNTELGIDFDGVVTNLKQLKSKVAKELYGFDIPPGKFKKKNLIEKGYFSPDAYHRFQKKVYETREIGLLVEPVIGALEHITLLRQNGFRITVVTSRSPTGVTIAREWFALHGMQMEVIGVDENGTKADYCTNFTVFLDDDLHKLEAMVGIVPHRFLFTWEYNQQYDTKHIARRVSSWKDFYQYITVFEGVR